MMDFNFGFDAFDIFNEAPAETKAEEKKETKETKATEAKAEPTEKKDTAASEETEPATTTQAAESFDDPFATPFDNTAEADIENEDDEDGLSTSDDEEKKASSKGGKKKAAPKKDEKLKGVVKVVGNGWTTNYGEAGAEYEPAKVCKALFDQGYKEIALATIKYSANKLYVNTINEHSSMDDTAMGDSISIVLGNFRVTYTPEDFTGLAPEEISLFDVSMKFQSANPQFAGCGLKFDAAAKTAVPTFTKRATIKPDQQYGVWTDNGIQQYVGADIKDDDVFVSETGTYFLVEKMPKNASQVYHVDLGLSKDIKAGKATEVYHLPFTIWVETFGTNKPCTAEDFGGKESVTKDEIIRYLGNAYRIFRSATRKFSISYDRNSGVVGVAVVSGEKGAADAASSSRIVNFFDCRERLLSVRERVEETALGLFKGYENDVDMLSLNVFEMSLPKIPGRLLDTIIREFRRDLTKENMVQIYYSVANKEYYLVKPSATYDKISVRYQMTHTKDILVMSIHSHNTMSAKFSAVDDMDEIYTGLFGVIGRLDTAKPDMSFRAGMEGKFKELYYEDIFTNGGEIA